jgi:hypothetical protein
MLALRRVGEATLLRDSDKIPELMNSIVRQSAVPECLSKPLLAAIIPRQERRML